MPGESPQSTPSERSKPSRKQANVGLVSLKRVWHRLFGHAGITSAPQTFRFWLDRYPPAYWCSCGEQVWMDDRQRVIRARIARMKHPDRPRTLQELAELYWAQDD